MLLSFLDGKQDLHSCTLVNRDWHNVFNPILWREIESHCDTEGLSPFVCSVAAARSLKKYGRHIQRLRIKCIGEDFQVFLTVAPSRFSRLHSIELMGHLDNDDRIADLLQRCSRRRGGVGLRRVIFDFYDYEDDGGVFAFGKKSVEALKEHFSTLEVFCVENPEFSSKDIQELLWSLAAPSEEYLALISNEDFTAVYSQLARLTHLEVLRMGIPYDTENMYYHRYDKACDRQYDCLAMSLESGLDLLGGLESLQVVALEDMEVGINDENEQKWVVEHWPRVRVLTTDFGTDRDDDSQLSGFYDEDSDEEFERHPEYLDYSTSSKHPLKMNQSLKAPSSTRDYLSSDTIPPSLRCSAESYFGCIADMDMHSEDPDTTEEDAILNRTIYDSVVEEPEEEASAVSSHQDTTADHSNAEAPIIVSGPDLTPADIARTAARKAEHDENVRRHVRTVVGNALLYDPYILETAEELNIPDESRITADPKGRLIFFLKASYLQDWISRHQVCIGTDFTSHGKPKSYSTAVFSNSTQSKKDRAGQVWT
ncbi:hypothetical protein KVV02_008154, partial [Mortierella alpina]